MLKLNTTFLKELQKMGGNANGVKKIGEKIITPLVNDQKQNITLNNQTYLLFIKNNCKVCTTIISELRSHYIKDLLLVSNSSITHEIPKGYTLMVSPELIHELGVVTTPTFIIINKEGKIMDIIKLTNFEELVDLVSSNSLAS
jgi:thioredoxin-related protein